MKTNSFVQKKEKLLKKCHHHTVSNSHERYLELEVIFKSPLLKESLQRDCLINQEDSPFPRAFGKSGGAEMEGARSGGVPRDALQGSALCPRGAHLAHGTFITLC